MTPTEARVALATKSLTAQDAHRAAGRVEAQALRAYQTAAYGLLALTPPGPDAPARASQVEALLQDMHAHLLAAQASTAQALAEWHAAQLALCQALRQGRAR